MPYPLARQLIAALLILGLSACAAKPSPQEQREREALSKAYKDISARQSGTSENGQR